ncbi:hypothetical protein [Pantoea sp. GL120224-02]|uniref:hypothetical protein n=1 Tax=Pantoea sp. GL120224-02 TaxID=1378084 RepID=UPI000BC82257|nr:hypothetical protein [Pantoea sp. GL120224-02]SNY70973.1 hypothetical protein SAMN02744778_03111 [Pantoea sp. GL120224-02]
MQLPSNRQSLYELVWSKPAGEIVMTFKISEQTLIARCVELQVPRPLDGYWRAVAKGIAPPVPSLLPYKDKESINPPNQPDVQQATEPEGEQLLPSVPKSVPKGRQKSPNRSIQGAQLFSATKEILVKSQITELGYYKPSKRKLLDVNVTDTGLTDAETFLLKLFAAAEKDGLRIRLADMSEGLHRKDITVSEDGGRVFMFTSLWRPSNVSVICIEGLNVGFSLVEMTEEVPTKQVKGRYVRDEKMISWSRGKNSADLGYYSRRHIPCGRFRIQLYSPYEPEGWHQVFTQTKNCGLISQIPKMIKAAQSAVPIMRKEIQAQKERAEAQRKRIELQIIEYEKREVIRRKEEAYKDSVNELQGIMTRWAEDMRVGQFFMDAEKDIENCDPVLQEKLRERLKAAREFMQGETALQRLLKWRTPDERLK